VKVAGLTYWILAPQVNLPSLIGSWLWRNAKPLIQPRSI